MIYFSLVMKNSQLISLFVIVLVNECNTTEHAACIRVCECLGY